MSLIGGLWIVLIKAGSISSSFFVNEMFSTFMLSLLYNIKTTDPKPTFREKMKAERRKPDELILKGAKRFDLATIRQEKLANENQKLLELETNIDKRKLT